MSLASKNVQWIKRFMRCIPFVTVPKVLITLYSINQATIHNTKNKRMSDYSKHFAMRYNYVRQ